MVYFEVHVDPIHVTTFSVIKTNKSPAELPESSNTSKVAKNG